MLFLQIFVTKTGTGELCYRQPQQGVWSNLKAL
jgi:hypothetical protein